MSSIEDVKKLVDEMATQVDALKVAVDSLPPTPPPIPPITGGDEYIVVKPDSSERVVLPTSLKPGQICIVDADEISQIIARNISSTTEEPIIVRFERPITTGTKYSYFEDLANVQFQGDSNHWLTIRGRSYIRRSENVTFSYVNWLVNQSVALTCRPEKEGDLLRGLRWDHCGFQAPNGEGAYLGSSSSHGDNDKLRMYNFTLLDCVFRNCAQAFHLSACYGFLVRNCLIENINPLRYPAHNAAVSIGRFSGGGHFNNNTIVDCPLDGLHLDTSRIAANYVDVLYNHIEHVAYATGADNLSGKQLAGMRLQKDVQVRAKGNHFKNIPLAIRGSANNDLVADNTFVDCDREVG